MNEETKYKVINPYHFVPLAKKCNRGAKSGELITGKMKIAIMTKTPLFIPNITSERKTDCDVKEGEEPKKEHSQYEFFSYHQYKSEQSKMTEPYEPIIPGSEIRGMVRGIYEAVTGSCLSAIELDKPLYKRTSDYYQHGMLEYSNGIINLYKLNVIDDIILADVNYVKGYKDGQYVTYRYENKKYGHGSEERKFVNEPIQSISENDIQNAEENCGVLFNGEKGVKKKWSKIFNVSALGKSIVWMDLSDEKIRAFEHVLQTYQDDRINKSFTEDKGWYKEYSKCWEELKKGERRYLPVYFSKLELKNKGNQKNIYLSPACITKESYFTSLESILKRDGFEPCKSSENMCPACQLFGMVGDNSVASKLRFSDARLNFSGNIYDYMYDHFVVLEELSQPKISATEMYLQRPADAEFWTYDYYVKNKKIEEYTASNPVQIMGRKFYWHHQFKEKKPSKTIRNKSVRLLKEGITFTENIYFENITREQLEQLYYLLNISKKEDESGHLHCYKLGSGKPLGLGSVSVQVIDVIERKFDLQSELIYREEPYKIEEKSYEDNGFDTSVKKAFNWATDFNIIGKQKVSYPLTEEQYESCYLTGDEEKTIEQGFEWFTENKGGKLKQRNSISVKENLKSINTAKSIEDIALSCWKKENKEQENKKTK